MGKIGYRRRKSINRKKIKRQEEAKLRQEKHDKIKKSYEQYESNLHRLLTKRRVNYD